MCVNLIEVCIIRRNVFQNISNITFKCIAKPCQYGDIKPLREVVAVASHLGALHFSPVCQLVDADALLFSNFIKVQSDFTKIYISHIFHPT